MSDDAAGLPTSKYVEYRPSNDWPLVISVPHDGDKLPEDIADRTSGCFEPDSKSYELSLELSAAFAHRRKERKPPAQVAIRLHRKKIDVNRARGPSCEVADDDAAKAWDAYHGSIEDALQRCVERFGFCLLLDLHGQSHRVGVTELGYLLTSEDLLLADEVVDSRPPRATCLDALISRRRSVASGQDGSKLRGLDAASLAGMVRGTKSLGACLGRRRCCCTPSPQLPHPVAKEDLPTAKSSSAVVCPPPPSDRVSTYFWGGYSVRRYGAPSTIPAHCNPLSDEAQKTWATAVGAVQLETSWADAREDEGAQRNFARALQEAAEEFLLAWTGWSADVEREGRLKDEGGVA
eukprot:TRINITY_DN49431_c0_g2_i1.p1 TRINITY_DN49431_c0_g2~~TRINITY_DN49431_c0_g2_i1.p1  ORF type:complete len:349 (-),score=64.17 TRINITY_DN49431_c0_g2_i1:93-1139(-)